MLKLIHNRAFEHPSNGLRPCRLVFVLLQFLFSSALCLACLRRPAFKSPRASFACRLCSRMDATQLKKLQADKKLYPKKLNRYPQFFTSWIT